MRLSFIGGGAMAEAIIRGVLDKGIAPASNISVGEAVEQRCEFLRQTHGVTATTDNMEAAHSGDLVVLAIKPQNLHEVLQQLEGRLESHQAALSIIAGAKMSTITQGLKHSAVIRVMPNTPAQIGEGISMWTCSNTVDGEMRERASAVLSTMGPHIEVDDEKYIDMATALSASGPAYVFTFIEALIDAGVHLGLPRDMARALALQTVLGSASLTKQTGKHPAELRDMVTSPGGTTAEALLALEQGGFRAAIGNAVLAAYRKSVELGAKE